MKRYCEWKDSNIYGLGGCDVGWEDKGKCCHDNPKEKNCRNLIEVGDKVELASFVYTGTIYEKQNPELLFQAIRELTDEGFIKDGEVTVRIYSNNPVFLETSIKKFGLEGSVSCYDFVSPEEAQKIQDKAHWLWIMKWEDPKEDWTSCKIYDYMRAGRPVIATGGHRDSMTKVIEETHIGVCCETVRQVKNLIRDIL